MTALLDRGLPYTAVNAAATTSEPLVAAREALAYAFAVQAEPALLENPPGMLDAYIWEAVPTREIRAALDQVLLDRFHVEEGLEALYLVGCLHVWLPELVAMVGMTDGEWKHKDVWKHTKQVVKQSVRRPEVRWGALLHDIGKPRTRALDERGRVTFHGHAELGARMFRKQVAPRLGFEGDFKRRLHDLILYHLRPGQYEVSWTDSALRRFYKEVGAALKDLLDLGRADITTKRPLKRKRGVQNITALKRRVLALIAADAYVKPLPKGLGGVLMAHFKLPPTKAMSSLMDALEVAANAGEVEAHADFAVYVDFVEANRERFLPSGQ